MFSNNQSGRKGDVLQLKIRPIISESLNGRYPLHVVNGEIKCAACVAYNLNISLTPYELFKHCAKMVNAHTQKNEGANWNQKWFLVGFFSVF